MDKGVRIIEVALYNIEKPGTGLGTRLAEVMYSISQFLDDFRTYNPQGIVALPKIVHLFCVQPHDWDNLILYLYSSLAQPYIG